MEELQHVLSELPTEDIAVAPATLRHEVAGLPHETARLPPETSLRSLRSDGAPYDEPPHSRQIRRMLTSSDGRARRQTKGRHSRRGATAAHPSPFVTVQTPLLSSFRDAGLCNAGAGGYLRASERCSERPSASIGRAKETPPRFVKVEVGSRAGGAKGLCSIPSEPGKPPASVSSCMASRTEALVRALSQKEKDRLLRQFLSPPRKPSRRGRRGEAGAGGSSNGNDLGLEESEVLDVQAGLWRSLRDQAETAVRDDLDDKAVKLGLRASQLEYRKLRRNPCEEALEEECVRLVVAASEREFREMRRRDKEEEIECNALIEKAKIASLLSSESCSPFLSRRESENYTSGPEDGAHASH